eukprot:scaffold48_cov311-Pinguiococcus_pyrenoidosus.AAC.55
MREEESRTVIGSVSQSLRSCVDRDSPLDNVGGFGAANLHLHRSLALLLQAKTSSVMLRTSAWPRSPTSVPA